MKPRPPAPPCGEQILFPAHLLAGINVQRSIDSILAGAEDAGEKHGPSRHRSGDISAQRDGQCRQNSEIEYILDR